MDLRDLKAMTIQISQGPVDDPWHKILLTWRGLSYRDGRQGATVSCNKGHSAALTDHIVAADGTVTPSLVCPEEGCDWHEMITLVDWTPE